MCKDKTQVVKNQYCKRWTSHVSSHEYCNIIVWCFKGTVSELLLTLWRSCRVSVCFCPACRSDSPTRTACLPDLRNQTTNTRTIARQRLNELIGILMSPNQTQRQTLFWCKPAEEKRHTHTISSEHFGFLQVIFKNTPSVSTTIFFPTGSNFHFDQTISLQKLNSNRENYSEQWSAHRRLEGEFHLSFSETWVE